MNVEENNKMPEQSPQEATTVGMFLKYTRQNQKKSIETVAKALCIRKIYIKAIEESDFKELPPVPYGVGFLRSYANYLGLNAERLVQCYKEEAMPKKADLTSQAIIKKHTSITIPNKKQMLIGFALLMILYSVTLIITDNKEFTPTEEETQITSTDSNEDSVQINEDIQDKINEALTEEIQQEDVENIKILEENYNEEEVAEKPEIIEPKNRVVVKFNGESWFKVNDNKKTYISGIYQKGFEYEIPDSPNMIVSFGRYYNVDVYIDGKIAKVAGPKKQTNIKLDAFLNH